MLTFSPPPTTCSREVTSDRVNPSQWATCRTWFPPTSSPRDSTTFITSERDTEKEGAERRGRRGLTRNELGVRTRIDLWYTNKTWTCECDGGSQLVTVMWPQYLSHMTSADSRLSHHRYLLEYLWSHWVIPQRKSVQNVGSSQVACQVQSVWLHKTTK